MSGHYLYCQNSHCGVYLGSLGGDSCPICGWSTPPLPEPTPDADASLGVALDTLESAANYIDTLGGDSTSYRVTLEQLRNPS